VKIEENHFPAPQKSDSSSPVRLEGGEGIIDDLRNYDDCLSPKKDSSSPQIEGWDMTDKSLIDDHFGYKPESEKICKEKIEHKEIIENTDNESSTRPPGSSIHYSGSESSRPKDGEKSNSKKKIEENEAEGKYKGAFRRCSKRVADLKEDFKDSHQMDITELECDVQCWLSFISFSVKPNKEESQKKGFLIEDSAWHVTSDEKKIDKPGISGSRTKVHREDLGRLLNNQKTHYPLTAYSCWVKKPPSYKGKYKIEEGQSVAVIRVNIDKIRPN